MEEKTNGQMTKGMEKRLARKKAIAAQKRKAMIGRIIGCVIVMAALVGLCVGVTLWIVRINSITKPIKDLGTGLTSEGLISGVEVGKYVSTIDYNNITVEYADVEYSDENVDNVINDLVASHSKTDTDAATEVKPGDTVVVDYATSADGKSIDSLTASAQHVTIGDNKLDFEGNLVGMHPGESNATTIEYAEDDENKELAGKEVVYAYTVLGVYSEPVLNDEFISANVEEGLTLEAYKKRLKDEGTLSNIKAEINKRIVDQSTVSEYPTEYYMIVKGVLRKLDEMQYEQYKLFLASYGQDVSDYTFNRAMDVKNDDEYEKRLKENAQKQLTKDFAMQYLYEQLGLKATEEDYNEYVGTVAGAENAEAFEKLYSKGFIMKDVITDKVLTHLAENATVNGR